MIKFVRVDQRLLHGQVAFSWSKFLGIDCILLASDALVKDELKMMAVKIAKPQNIKLVIKNIDDSIKAINSGATDKSKLFIICETIEEAARLAKETNGITSINLGGTRQSEDKKQISKAVFVSKEDEAVLADLLDRGIDINMQLVPNDTKTAYTKALGGEHE